MTTKHYMTIVIEFQRAQLLDKYKKNASVKSMNTRLLMKTEVTNFNCSFFANISITQLKFTTVHPAVASPIMKKQAIPSWIDYIDGNANRVMSNTR